MDNFLGTHNPPKLNQEEIDNLNRLITKNEIEYMIKKKNSLQTKVQDKIDGFTSKFYQTYKEEIIPILLKLFQKTEVRGTLPKTFCEAIITLIPKSDKDTTKKEKLLANIVDEYRCRNSQQNFSKPNQNIKNVIFYD